MDTTTSDIRTVEIPPAETETAPSCRTSWSTFPKTKTSTPPMMPMTRTAATARSSSATRSRSSRSAGTGAPPERGLTGCPGQKRDPALQTPLRQGILESLDRIPRLQPHRGEDAMPQSLRRTHRCTQPRPTDRGNPLPHHHHKPLQRPRHSRDRTRGLKLKGKGSITPQADVLQQRPLTTSFVTWALWLCR